MSKKRKLVIAVILVPVICLAVAGCLMYRQQQYDQARFAMVGETRYERTIEAIDLSGAPVGDLTQLQAFPGLKQIDLRNTGLTCGEYDGLKARFPEAEILWDIPFQGQYLDMHTRELTLTALTQEDLAVLPYFTELKTIHANGCTDYANLHELRIQRPDLEITYQLTVADTAYAYDVENLTLPGESVEELFTVLPFLTELKNVELTVPLAPIDRILALLEAFPEVTFSWNLELAGIPVDESTEKLDLTGIPMTVEELDAVLPHLLSLTYVDMTDCGISNEEMDALNRRYENTKIVWTVNIGRFIRVRTDATWFMPIKSGYCVTTEDVYNLRYCTDMVSVDIGHMQVSNCEWARYMPKLKYLIIADTLISDISPLAGLQELVFLEMFLTRITDYSPLLECPALEDLNLHYTNGDPEIIKQLTWVNNVWWANVEMSNLERQELQDALPNTHFEFWSLSSTGAGWRNLQNYYDHRDLMGMFYDTY